MWPDDTLGPFGPQDKRFQLPGNVGFARQLDSMTAQTPGPMHATLPDVLSASSNAERHEFVLAQFINEFHVITLSVVRHQVESASIIKSRFYI